MLGLPEQVADIASTKLAQNREQVSKSTPVRACLIREYDGVGNEASSNWLINV